MADQVIEVEGLTRHFGENKALDGVTFSVARGEVFGFLGHNGAGKTTTIRILNGVLTASSGEVKVLGYDPESQGPLLRKLTGVLTENPANDERLTARENLRFYADLFGLVSSEINSRVSELLDLFELGERADERVGGYSKGMKQRLALARALLHNPALVYLDEPTSGLDPVASRRVHNLIGEMKSEGRTIFLCTHNLVEAQRLCDRVAVLENGRVLALGTPRELAQTMGQRLHVELEVEQSQLQAAKTALDGVLGPGSVVLEESLIMVSGVVHPMIPDLLDKLVRSGIRIYRVTPHEASLEDIYFALHGDDGQGNGEK